MMLTLAMNLGFVLTTIASSVCQLLRLLATRSSKNAPFSDFVFLNNDRAVCPMPFSFVPDLQV